MKAVTAVINFVKREPAILTTVAADGISVAADVGLHLTAAQQRGVFAAASAVTALLVRSAVTPNTSVPPAVDPALVQRVAALEAALNELAAPKAV